MRHSNRIRQEFTVVVTSASAFVLSNVMASHLPRYTLVDLTGEAGDGTGGARDINEGGQVVGWSGPGWVRWHPLPGNRWVTTPLESDGALCYFIDEVPAINNRGAAVGDILCDNLMYFALLWEAEENVAYSVGYGHAVDINDFGQIVGHYGGAWVWDDGALTMLGSGQALGINEQSEIAGWMGSVAILWVPTEPSGWEPIELGTLGGPTSLALDVNEASQVVGISSLPDGSFNPFLWVDGSMSDLGALAGFSLTYSQAINNGGQVVGYAVSEDNELYRPFLWQNGMMYDLNELVVAGPELELRGAQGINDKGQIVGWSKAPPDGDFHAFLLNPLVPGDVDADGVVDAIDLALLLRAWGPCRDCSGPLTCLPDLDGNCLVGTSDLLTLLANWGSG